MAAVPELLSPVDIIADSATTALSSADKFYEARPTASGNSKSYTFPLESESFVNLQRYLFAASKLPSSNAAFETSYPRALLEPQIKQRSANDVSTFYDEMQNVLVGINNHCDAFHKDTMSESVLVASQFADFANEASMGASTMGGALVVLSQPGVRTDQPNYQDALTNISSATDMLRNSAKNAEAECRKVYKGLTDFKKVVEDDRIALETIDKQFDELLPTADLDANMRSKVQAAYKSIIDTLHSKNELEAKRKRWLFFFPAVGIVIGIPEWLIRNKKDRAALRQSISDYKNTMSKLKTDVQHGTRLRAASRQLGKAIDEVLSTINAAVLALVNMIGAFATLVTNLEGIDGMLETIASAAVSPYMFKRKAALGTLHRVSETIWLMAVSLARRFVENGIVVTKEFDISAVSALPNVVEITGANWGGLDVTDDAKALFYDGANIRIRTVVPGFQDPWSGVLKTCSVLHRYGDSVRLFVCRENSGEKHEHVLRAGTIDKSHIEDAQLLEIQTRVPPAPAGSKITIRAIVWGCEFVENPQAYTYVYGCHADGTSVKFANDSVGGGKDTWVGNPKSGTVYYVLEGGSQVRQVTGREGQEIAF